jgi:hypothetical protein
MAGYRESGAVKKWFRVENFRAAGHVPINTLRESQP